MHTDSLYHLELARDQPVCASIDSNFKALNMSISLYDFQAQNGILDTLERNPHYTFSVFPGSSLKKKISLSAYARPTIPWKLECDKTGVSRKVILEQAKRGL